MSLRPSTCLDHFIVSDIVFVVRPVSLGSCVMGVLSESTGERSRTFRELIRPRRDTSCAGFAVRCGSPLWCWRVSKLHRTSSAWSIELPNRTLSACERGFSPSALGRRPVLVYAFLSTRSRAVGVGVPRPRPWRGQCRRFRREHSCSEGVRRCLLGWSATVGLHMRCAHTFHNGTRCPT